MYTCSMSNDDGTKHLTLIRSLSLADAITFGNAASGFLSITVSMAYLTGEASSLAPAFVLLCIALICDFLDGAVARGLNCSSPLGADLDSLSDVISFGVAPAVIGYALGLRGTLDLIFLTTFVLAGVSRLARYNVTASSMSNDCGKVSHYEGTPIPANLFIVLVLLIAYIRGHVGEGLPYGSWEPLGGFVMHPIVLLYGFFTVTMVSKTLRIPKP